MLFRASRRRTLAAARDLFVTSSLAFGCGSVPSAAPPAPSACPLPPPPHGPGETPPHVRLPRDTRPTSEALVLNIDPKLDRFSGVADLTVALDHPRTTIWMHGKGFFVRSAIVTDAAGVVQNGEWKQVDDSGMAGVTVTLPIAAGEARLHIEYEAPFGPKLEGLYKVAEAGVPYAFTQFESIAARDAFPCFDEPGFKIPWDETLVVPEGAEAIANTHEIERKSDHGSVRVHFAPTKPLPSYLLAFAVGPLDIVTGQDVPANAVRKRSLPLRAITTKGRGKEIAYALAHTGEILAVLESYFGIEYPYDKLDIIAVSDKGGAMENAGAVTFADSLLLFDPATAPLRQRKAYAGVMAHELAHQWVGDLVTAAWWDEIWMNEAFATWVGTKAADLWDPTIDASSQLLSRVQGAMGEDAKVSARSIRQPIESTNDIENAFDSITYQKGGGVLSMFERWVGPDKFQRGLHDYLEQHSWKSGTADDFLEAESRATGKDLKTPFHTFLDQPGVPFLDAEVKCEPGAAKLAIKQSRYLPMGSKGDANKTWQIPVCVRWGTGKETHETCSLVTERETSLPLGNICPDWVFPNANASGYYRFSLTPKDLAELRQKGLPKLSPRERVAFGNSLRAGFNRQTLSFKDSLLAAAALANDERADVAGEPMSYVSLARDWLSADPLRSSVEAYGQALFRTTYARLGWTPLKGENGDRVQLRSRVIGFLAMTARDPIVRAEARKRGLAFLGQGTDGAIHRDAIDSNLVGIALTVVGEEADAALWDSVKARLAKTDDAVLRGWLLAVLQSPEKPELVARVRALPFDPVLRATEVTAPIWSEMHEPALRRDTWQWVKASFDKLLDTVPKHHGQTQLISMGGELCDEADRQDVEAFFTKERLAKIDGGPRVLAGALEDIHLCATKKSAQEASARDLFGKKK